MATHAPRAPLRPNYRPWNKVRNDQLYGFITLLTIGSVMLFAAVSALI